MEASRSHPACSCGEQDNPPDGRFCITCGKPFAWTAGPRRTLNAGAVVALSLILAGGIYLLARFLSPSPASMKPASSGRGAKQSRGGSLPDALPRLPAGEAGTWNRRGGPGWERPSPASMKPASSGRGAKQSRGGSLPDALQRLPAGEAGAWVRRGGPGFEQFRTGFRAASSEMPLPELAVVTRGKQLVVLLLGRFDVKANEDALAFVCRRKKVDGVNLWLRVPGGVLRDGRRHTVNYEACYVAGDRVVYGARDLVLETVKGPSRTFDKTVTSLEREMIAKVGWTDFFTLIRGEVRGPIGHPFGRGKIVSTVLVERIEKQETTRLTAAALYDDEDAAVSGERTIRKSLFYGPSRIRRDGRILFIEAEKHAQRSLPDALQRLPAGEAGTWFRRGGPGWERLRAGFASSHMPLPYIIEKAAELAMVERGGRTVVLLLGRFDVKASDDALAFLCRRKKVEGFNLWLRIPGGVLRGGRRYTLSYEACYVAGDRVVLGARDLVLETVKGPSRTFDETVTYLEREMIASVDSTDSFSLIRREARIPASFGRGKIVSTVLTERVVGKGTRLTAAALYDDEDAAVSGERTIRKSLVDRARGSAVKSRFRRDGRILFILAASYPYAAVVLLEGRALLDQRKRLQAFAKFDWILQREPGHLEAAEGRKRCLSLVVAPGGDKGVYPRIQDALSDAPEGAVIRVRPGRYNEVLQVDRSVSLVADGKPGSVQVRNAGRCLYHGNRKRIAVRGFSFHTAAGAEAISVGGTLELVDCTVTARSGVGVVILQNSTLRLTRSAVHDCGKIGISVSAGSRGEVQDSEIHRCGSHGVLVAGKNAHVLVRRTKVHDCKGTGLFADKGGSLELLDVESYGT